MPRVSPIINVTSVIALSSGRITPASIRSVHEDYRGRVVSLWTLAAMGSPAFGAALIGALAEVWGFILVLVFTGIAGVIVMAWLYTRRGRLASLSV